MSDRPSKTYRVVNGRILTMTDGREAMIQAIDKILRTERFVYPIYDDQYGNDLEQLFGKSFAYAIVEVERMVKEALLSDDRVLSVNIASIEQVDKNILKVTGSCTTIFGQVPIGNEVRIE